MRSLNANQGNQTSFAESKASCSETGRSRSTHLPFENVAGCKLLCLCSAKALGGLGHIFGICLEFRNLAVIMNLAFDPAS